MLTAQILKNSSASRFRVEGLGNLQRVLKGGCKGKLDITPLLLVGVCLWCTLNASWEAAVTLDSLANSAPWPFSLLKFLHMVVSITMYGPQYIAFFSKRTPKKVIQKKLL